MRTVDLFAGCGGLSLGFQNAGFDIVAAFDNWQPAIDIYQQNFKHTILKRDLANIENYHFLKNYNPELIIGGPPCQDFSSAGKRTESIRADLTVDFAKIIAHTQPQMFVMENVERIVSTNALKSAIHIFKSMGYGLTSSVLNASLCDVPQLRKRFFLIGILDEKDNILSSFLSENLRKEPMTVFDYLGNSLGVKHYYRHPRSYARRGVFSIHEPSPTVRGVNRPIPPNYQFHSGDTCKNIDEIRPLTTIERSYLQTFPKDWHWEQKSKSDLEQMIGNAVPVKQAEYVAKALKRYLNQDIPKMTYQYNEQLSMFAV